MRSAHRSTTLRTCVDRQCRERRVVLGREQHDLGRADCGQRRDRPTSASRDRRGRRRERGPTVREPTHVVGLGRFETADAERAAGLGRFGRAWRWPTMFTHSRVKRIAAELARTARPWRNTGPNDSQDESLDDVAAVVGRDGACVLGRPAAVLAPPRREHAPRSARAHVRRAGPLLEHPTGRVLHRRHVRDRRVLGAAGQAATRRRSVAGDGAARTDRRRGDRAFPRRILGNARGPPGRAALLPRRARDGSAAPG